MKMTQEEKAKLYDEALSRAKECHNDGLSLHQSVKDVIEYIFPELKESEDKRIKKAIHIYLDWLDGRKDYEPKGEYSIRDMITWLENQCDCSVMWEKNTANNKPISNHSVLMKSIYGISEGEWNNEDWIQYRWSSKIKDSDVLYWMNLSELEIK